MRKIYLLVLVSLFTAANLFAGGYQVRLQGNKQTGFGLIGTPLNMGASSMFYNPGALSFADKTWNFEVGASGIMSYVTYERENSDYQAETDNPLGTPFYFYGSGKINKLVSVGLAIYTPYGSTSKWDPQWAGKYLIQDISLKAIYFQPTVSFNINDVFGIGVGFIYTSGSVELNKALNYGDNSSVSLDGSSGGFGFNIGLYFKASDRLSVGVDYRSKITMSVEDGDATFTVPPALSGVIPENNKFSAELPLPANLDFGISFMATDKLQLAFELDWVMWSTYQNLTFEFEEQGELLNSTNPRDYKDSFIPRLGAEYKLFDNLCLRAGLYYDATPTNEEYFSPETVSLNTFAYTLGLSWEPLEFMSVDVSYLQTFGQQSYKTYKPDNFSGTYKSAAYIPGLGLTFKF
jgi:long-chain fatty acid transport protein